MASAPKRLPRLIALVVRSVVPAQRADTVISDLEDDYSRAHRSPRWWLVKETVSLLSAYAHVRIMAVRRSLPLLLRDVQLVLRGLRRGAGAMMAAAALLSVGIAAGLLTAGLAETLLFRHVSSTHQDSLRRITAVDNQNRVITRFSFPEVETIRAHVVGRGDLTAVYLQPVVIRINNTDVQTMAEIVDGRYFALTGTRTLLGRSLLSTDQQPQSSPVAVLSEPFWRRHFDGAPTALGATVLLNGTAYTVVGVAATRGSSTFLGASVDAWVSVAHADPLLNAGWRTNVRDRWFTLFVLPQDHAAVLDGLLVNAAADLARSHADPWRDRRLLTGDATVMIGSQRSSAAALAVVLGGLSALILCAAAANVSSVLLARAGAQLRMAAIHMSIGAGRATVIRRQLLEGTAIGLASSVMAVGLYAWARVQLGELSVLPTLALRLDLPLTPTVIASTVLGGGILGTLLALGPALWSTRVDLAQALRDADRGAVGGARVTALRRVLVATQVGISIVLIAGAALFVQSVSALNHADLGFAREQLVAMDFDVEPVMRSPLEASALAREALTRIDALPAVTAAALSNRAPVDQSTPAMPVQIVGADSSRINDVTMYLATERYFETVGVPIVRGRSFSSAEVAAAADVAVINESLAQSLWPGSDALERAIYLPTEARTLRVVGIARDSKYRTITESGRPHFYRPTAPNLGLTLLARTRGDAREALRAMQRELDSIGPGLVGFFARTLDDHLAVQLLPARAAARAATLLGVLALLLSTLALYTLVAWFVAQRRREIGIRMALGARARDVRRLVVGQALGAALPGAIAGLILAVGLGTAARSTLFGVSPTDPIALGVAVGALLVVIGIAGYLPSRAAAATDPVLALRQ